jgi:hypothetical protein
MSVHQIFDGSAERRQFHDHVEEMADCRLSLIIERLLFMLKIRVFKIGYAE